MDGIESTTVRLNDEKSKAENVPVSHMNDEDDLDIVQLNDFVCIYCKFNQVLGMTVTENLYRTCDFGKITYELLIRRKYGSTIKLSKGFVHLLRLDPVLWTKMIPHRTQILYSHDNSLISNLLDVRPGKTIVECGTGSGSLTHTLIHGVAPHGKVLTFDFHEERVEKAIEEFAEHHLSDCVEVRKRNICQEGFGDEFRGVCHSIFLDIPTPWLVIESTINCLKDEGGTFVSFSPCIEQIQKTLKSLTDLCRQSFENEEFKRKIVVLSSNVTENFQYIQQVKEVVALNPFLVTENFRRN
ncbi:hypothetical protein SNEBB_008295 [Seison nebaliae]|nr:hypothetical protein SNEBB_008295 [Seison nebaliae]